MGRLLQPSAQALLHAVLGLQLVACGADAPEPTLTSVQPQAAYSDQQTRVFLQGTNFVPAFTLDLAQGLRLPSATGFTGKLEGPGSSVPLMNLLWLSPTLLQADISPGAADLSGSFHVAIWDPRGQQALLPNGFASLGPDQMPPTLLVSEPAVSRPLAPGVLLPVRFSGKDTAPGQLRELRYKIQWREQVLVDGRCEVAAGQDQTECAFNALVPSEALPHDVFQINVSATDSAQVANTTSQTLRWDLRPNPRLLSIAQTQGSTAGGTDLVVGGVDFDPSTQVLIGGQLLAPDGGRWIDAQTIAGRTPPGTGGLATVEIKSLTGNGRLETPRGFTYLPELMITGLTRETAPGSGGVPISIRGVSFTPHTTIVFGDRSTNGVPMVNQVVRVPNEIRGWVPSGVGSTFVWAVDPLLGKSRWMGVFRWTSEVMP